MGAAEGFVIMQGRGLGWGLGRSLGSGVHGLVQGLGSGVCGPGHCLGSWAWGLGQGLGSGIWGLESVVWGSGVCGLGQGLGSVVWVMVWVHSLGQGLGSGVCGPGRGLGRGLRSGVRGRGQGPEVWGLESRSWSGVCGLGQALGSRPGSWLGSEVQAGPGDGTEGVESFPPRTSVAFQHLLLHPPRRPGLQPWAPVAERQFIFLLSCN